MCQSKMTPLTFYRAYIGILTIYVLDLWMNMVHSSNIAVSPNMAKMEDEHFINLNDDYAIKQLAVIVDALENLDILGGNKRNCYMVDKISQHSQQIDPTRWKVGIEFYISLIQPTYIDKLNNSEISGGYNVNNSQSAQNSSSIKNVTSSCQITILEQSEGNNSFAQNDNTSIAKPENGRETVTDKAWREKLSHTQIMVISTCSAVIGVFFIIAMIMRVRNYLKRKSVQERDSRGQLSSTSMALRSSSHSPARTESIASKCGCPDSKTSLNSHLPPSPHINGSVVNNHHRYKPTVHHHTAAPDNKPLLVITSASAPSSPHTYQTQPSQRSYVKQKVTQSPSAPLEGSGTKDYLTINRSHSMKRAGSNTTQQSTSKQTRSKPRQIDIRFGEYYREAPSSDSSISELTQSSPLGSKNRNDSSTSNQSGYESSVSSNITDCSLPPKYKIQERNTNLLYEPKDNTTLDNFENDDVFDQSTTKVSTLQDSVLLTILSPSNQREKRLSSSSSHGRKSVSFSLDVKVNGTDDCKDGLDDDEEDVIGDHHNNYGNNHYESSLLLQPEFLGMEPTYV